MVLVTTCDGSKNNVMTISWTMVLDFTPLFAITTGAWNHSFAALRRTRECVVAVPTVDLLDRVVGIGTCSGADTDKFAKFKLTALPGRLVSAPLIKECLANIECKVVDLVDKHNIVVPLPRPFPQGADFAIVVFRPDLGELGEASTEHLHDREDLVGPLVAIGHVDQLPRRRPYP